MKTLWKTCTHALMKVVYTKCLGVEWYKILCSNSEPLPFKCRSSFIFSALIFPCWGSQHKSAPPLASVKDLKSGRYTNYFYLTCWFIYFLIFSSLSRFQIIPGQILPYFSYLLQTNLNDQWLKSDTTGTDFWINLSLPFAAICCGSFHLSRKVTNKI